jgi:hypothetical protein
MTNNKQQTAVEWFHQKTWALKIQLEKGEISIGKYANTYATLYEQAKEMEKEIMIDFAYNALKIADNTRNRYVDVDKLYKELYGGGEQ